VRRRSRRIVVAVVLGRVSEGRLRLNLGHSRDSVTSAHRVQRRRHKSSESGETAGRAAADDVADGRQRAMTSAVLVAGGGVVGGGGGGGGGRLWVIWYRVTSCFSLCAGV
jgi:hypothetical protein